MTEIKKPGVGDLVKWTSNAPLFKRAMESYCNPGIVVEIMPPRYKKSISNHHHGRAVVCWADGTITTEHTGFLDIVF